MKFHRRQFLETAAVGTAGLLATGVPLQAEQASAAADPMALVPLGKRLKVTRISMGTGIQGGNRSSQLKRMEEDKSQQLIAKAYDEGIRYFDMADLYGTHQNVGRTLKDKPRDGLIYVSKVWLNPGGLPGDEREDADVAVKRFLKEVGTDYLDLVQLHCMGDGNWPKTMRKQMDLMEGLREKGLIRAHGVSVHSFPALEAAADEPWVDAIHVRINHDGASMDNKLDKVVPVLKKIHDSGKGVIGMKIFAQGRFRNDPAAREASIRYVLGLGTVDTLVIGFEKPEEIDNLKELAKLALETKKT
jgi:aryl-alcohol dehydrogenase-like predicted oxidoreductase